MAPRKPESAPSSPVDPTSPSNPDPTTTGPLMFAEPTPSPSDLPDDWPSDDVSDELPPAPAPADPTSSRASSGSALSKTALRDVIRAAVIAAGAAANEFLTRDELERQNGLYATDERDAEAIGDPLANIANRRGGLGAAGNPDVVDAIEAIIGAGLYLTRQIILRRAINTARQNPPRQGDSDGRSEAPEGDGTHPAETAALSAPGRLPNLVPAD